MTAKEFHCRGTKKKSLISSLELTRDSGLKKFSFLHQTTLYLPHSIHIILQFSFSHRIRLHAESRVMVWVGFHRNGRLVNLYENRLFETECQVKTALVRNDKSRRDPERSESLPESKNTEFPVLCFSSIPQTIEGTSPAGIPSRPASFGPFNSFRGYHGV
jgi:hypothetical protein